MMEETANRVNAYRNRRQHIGKSVKTKKTDVLVEKRERERERQQKDRLKKKSENREEALNPLVTCRDVNQSDFCTQLGINPFMPVIAALISR